MTSHRVDPHAARVVSGRPSRPVLLVLEDDASARDLLLEVGGDAGWDVRGASTIASLRHALDERLPDLLIIDDDVGDGRTGDLARELRAGRHTRDMPIMIVTDAQPRRRAELATLAWVLPKPFDLVDLERHLTRADGTHRGGRAGQPAG